MKAIIIDDEKRARVSLALLLQEYCPNLQIIDQCENLPQAVKSIIKNKPDLVFLDIEMPGHSGLELFDFFEEEALQFQVIFTTAYSEYAIQAFKFSAVDYLLKPIVGEELQLAVQRAEKNKMGKENLEVLKENLSHKTNSKIAIPSGNSLVFLDVNTIKYIKGDGSYSDVVLQNGTKHTVSRNLKNFEEIICQNKDFLRVHKSYIVNLQEVVLYNKSDGGSLQLTNNTHIPISTDKVEMVLEKIQLIKR
jgi:two-component system, LytTR family, response regulator